MTKHQVGVRLTEKDYEVLSAAAARAGIKTVASYLRVSALVAAEVTISDELEMMKKEVKDYDADQ